MPPDFSDEVVCIDFDGVLRSYNGYDQPVGPGDEPVRGSRDAVEWFVRHKAKVVILTARPERNHWSVRQWLTKHGFPPGLEVTNVKPPAHLYIDDRACRFEQSVPEASWASAMMLFDDSVKMRRAQVREEERIAGEGR